MRVMIATVTAGGGHLQAARALQEAWAIHAPRDKVEVVDVLDHVSRLYRKMYTEGYLKLVEHAPELWGMVFQRTDDDAQLRKLTDWRRKIARNAYWRFVKVLDRMKPDLVVCTHYLPVGILAGVRAKRGQDHPFLACVITDFEAHAMWLESMVDLYGVATGRVAQSLHSRGIHPQHIAVTGIPILPKFAEHPPVRELRRTLGLRDDLPTILVLSGGFGMGPIAEILQALDKVTTPFQTVVVTGRNEELRREIAPQDRTHPTHVRGFVQNMNELLPVASLVITKPGGLTTSEALACGCPLLVVNPIPGQETANSDFLLEQGAAVKVNRPGDITARLKELLESPRLVPLKKAARRLGQPQAALQAVQIIRHRASPKHR